MVCGAALNPEGIAESDRVGGLEHNLDTRANGGAISRREGIGLGPDGFTIFEAVCVAQGTAGLAPGSAKLDETQLSSWRSGHAHAGVWVFFSLVIEALVGGARLSSAARISVPVAAVAESGGFFSLAFFPVFRWRLYFGGLCLVVSVVLTGVGLLRNLGG